MAATTQNNASSLRAVQEANAQIIKEAQQTPPKKQGVKGGLVLFWLVAGLALGKDLIDIFTSILDLLGLGLQAVPVVGTAAGAAIAFFSLIVDFLSGMLIDFTMFAYFSYIGGKLARRLAVMSIGAIIDMIPGLNVLPLTTAMFFLAYFIGKLGIARIVGVASKTSIGKKLLST